MMELRILQLFEMEINFRQLLIVFWSTEHVIILLSDFHLIVHHYLALVLSSRCLERLLSLTAKFKLNHHEQDLKSA